MSEENTQVEDTSGQLTDEQIAEQFPGQDPAHIRAMVNKMTGQPTEEAQTPAAEEAPAVEYPEWIPEKFRQGTVEEAMQKLASSYGELEKSRQTPAEAAQPQEQQPAETPDPATQKEQAEQQPTLRTAQEEFLKSGEITDGTYEALEKVGLSREMVDDYMAGQQAIADQLVTKAHSIAGGPEEYAALMDWAASNWSQEEIEAYDTVMTQGSESAIKLAIAGLMAARGSSPTLRKGGDGNSAVAGYQSKAEMTADMKDPKYRTDPAYRKMVEQKIAVSNVW